MERDRDKMADRIITLTLHILFLLTGEDYTVVKKSSSGRCGAPGCEGWGRTLSPIPGPLIHEEMEEEKILEVTNKMVELLSGELRNQGEEINYTDDINNIVNEEETDVSSNEQYKEEITTGKNLNYINATDKVIKDEEEEEETDDSSDEQYKDIGRGKHLNSINDTDTILEQEETDDSSDEQYKEDITTGNRPVFPSILPSFLYGLGERILIWR
ncbi:protein CLEC16A homolog [Dendropsophus ebraccatus]|uniref:protein CLEC16A homolog n=1 Tax=Dendropsophus ebraccatus TaxID=150705 RepID=UPI003831DDB4